MYVHTVEINDVHMHIHMCFLQHDVAQGLGHKQQL